MFAPDVQIELSTPVPKAVPALVSTVSQADGQTPVKQLSVEFPGAFGFNERFHPQRCQRKEEENRACPPASQIGTVVATSMFGPANGTVNITDDFRLVIFADAFEGAIQIKVDGVISASPRNGFIVTFTGLPNLPIQSLTLSLAGDDLGLIKNPVVCGDYSFPVKAISHEDETFEAAPSATISGCPPALVVSGVKVSLSGARATVRWSTTGGAEATRVSLQRRRGDGWRTLATKRTSTTKLTTGTLASGSYRVRLRALADGRVSKFATKSFRVR